MYFDFSAIWSFWSVAPTCGCNYITLRTFIAFTLFTLLFYFFYSFNALFTLLISNYLLLLFIIFTFTLVLLWSHISLVFTQCAVFIRQSAFIICESFIMGSATCKLSLNQYRVLRHHKYRKVIYIYGKNSKDTRYSKLEIIFKNNIGHLMWSF